MLVSIAGAHESVGPLALNGMFNSVVFTCKADFNLAWSIQYIAQVAYVHHVYREEIDRRHETEHSAVNY